ncbi:MAG TPA: PP2C family serine/threonine-protein phosphatase [Candidatus Sulfotelmatobacter sp.]|nr:PP2C family serine/threonine-protein phosphatase [Candidatus Sulfotelmatobacter sp.]
MIRSGDLTLEIAALTDRGTVRQDNQDVFAIVPLPGLEGAALLVADGMGGHAGGGKAAQAAVAAAAQALQDVTPDQRSFESVFRAADEAVVATREVTGLSGTTLVIALISPERVVIGNVGDSRAYVLTEGEARQITLDHTELAEYLRSQDSGATSTHRPSRNSLTRALTGEAFPADFFEWKLRPGEILLLCSDGVWDALDDSDLYRLLSAPGSVQSLAEQACEAALAAGSRDNVTVAICRARVT